MNKGSLATIILIVIATTFPIITINYNSMTCCNGSKQPRSIYIDDGTEGSIEVINKIANVSLVSNNPNVYIAEYNAGFMQGALQPFEIRAARDNAWNTGYLIDPTHQFPTKIPPTKRDREWAQENLETNLNYTFDYIKTTQDQNLKVNMRRLMYRLIGIYHGAINRFKDRNIQFNETWYPNFSEQEMTLGYNTCKLSFMDVYFINAFNDLTYCVPKRHCQLENYHLSKCSAFVKKTPDNIFIAHNSWDVFFAQTMSANLCINGDYLSINAATPGLLASGTDFGYNNKGIMFNETTTMWADTIAKVASLWMFWRAALAEEFSNSIDEFYEYLSLEASGTYMNGYMIVDTKTKDIGLVEMSYKSFIYIKLNGSQKAFKTKPQNLSTDYDPLMVQPDYILGFNYPAFYLIQQELGSVDNRPARKIQFLERIGSVNDIEKAKSLITYINECNPLSIYGRWDLGYGVTSCPKPIPEGAIDAKAISADDIKYTENIKGIFDPSVETKTFWMKFGTPEVDGKPFIWSDSQWRGWCHPAVPNNLGGKFTYLTTHIK